MQTKWNETNPIEYEKKKTYLFDNFKKNRYEGSPRLRDKAVPKGLRLQQVLQLDDISSCTSSTRSNNNVPQKSSNNTGHRRARLRAQKDVRRSLDVVELDDVHTLVQHRPCTSSSTTTCSSRPLAPTPQQTPGLLQCPSTPEASSTASRPPAASVSLPTSYSALARRSTSSCSTTCPCTSASSMRMQHNLLPSLLPTTPSTSSCFV